MNESLDQKIRHRNAVARAHTQVSRGQTTMLMVKEGPGYSGRAMEVGRIALVNTVLTLLTVGIYRFWAKTKLRRYLVSRVSFLGDPLEYSGTGMELFIGFLIIMAVMVPVFIAANLLQGFLTQPGTNPLSFVEFQVGYLIALYFLYNVAVYRAQRYRLSRISWRGIRGGQEGSALLYALYALGLVVATLITVGLAYPLMRRVLIGYRINRACFGTERLRFGGGTLNLMGAWLVPWLLVLALLGANAYLSSTALMEAGGENPDPDQIREQLKLAWAGHLKYVIPLALLLPIAFAWYRTCETRVWVRGTKFDQLDFTTRLNLFHIFIPYAVYMVLLFAIVGTAFFALAHFIDLSHWQSSNGLPAAGPPLLFFAVVVVAWLAASLLHPVILLNWMIRNLCKTLTIQGRFSPDTLFQNQLEIPRSGEGLADALDIDAF
jgi:uncharacterized membrane protein YjgN (DUF898 family)